MLRISVVKLRVANDKLIVNATCEKRLKIHKSNKKINCISPTNLRHFQLNSYVVAFNRVDRNSSQHTQSMKCLKGLPAGTQ